MDANVIIEAFRVPVWQELSNGCLLETVEEVEREALTGDSGRHGRVIVDATAMRGGLQAVHGVDRSPRNALLNKHPACVDMDPGEQHLFAYLFSTPQPLPPLIVVSSADKGVVVRAGELGWLDQLISLEELLSVCSVSAHKLKRLDEVHGAAFLGNVRTKVRMGIIP
ncbi:hypothetical protein [Roseateles terrae]|uniref:hypothetical protein n=1 Tax=Roseateles terrae TaxID=431060 RepID=UPI00160CA579|nr:hypothetical protein [Roseateles terrae]